jgi:hypothetical protein
MSKERIAELNKLIKIAETDRKLALFNYQYGNAALLKAYKNELLEEKRELGRKLSED